MGQVQPGHFKSLEDVEKLGKKGFSGGQWTACTHLGVYASAQASNALSPQDAARTQVRHQLRLVFCALPRLQYASQVGSGIRWRPWYGGLPAVMLPALSLRTLAPHQHAAHGAAVACHSPVGSRVAHRSPRWKWFRGCPHAHAGTTSDFLARFVPGGSLVTCIEPEVMLAEVFDRRP